MLSLQPPRHIPDSTAKQSKQCVMVHRCQNDGRSLLEMTSLNVFHGHVVLKTSYTRRGGARTAADRPAVPSYRAVSSAALRSRHSGNSI